MKRRLDILIVERGLAESRTRAQALVMEGKVRVAGQTEYKASRQVDDETLVEIESPPRFVSRGGEKLEGAFELWGTVVGASLRDAHGRLGEASLPVKQALVLNAEGKICLDVGSSTGGFSDCLLQHGARRVMAIDVGTNQLASQADVEMAQAALRELESESTEFPRLKPFASAMAVYTGICWVLDIFGIGTTSTAGTVIMLILSLISFVVGLYMLYCVIEGIADMEDSYGADLGVAGLRSVFKIMVVAEIAAFVREMASAVEFAPVPAMIFTRPAANSIVFSMTLWCSSCERVGDSPLVPTAQMPSTPFSHCQSTNALSAP